MKKHWHFIVNPISGKGKGLIYWDRVEPLLKANEISYSFDISMHHKHAIDLVAEKYIKGVRDFIGIGGDGTINEIINGIFASQKSYDNDLCTVSLLPVGTGNDWVRNHEEQLNEKNIISKIKAQDAYFHDVGVVRLESPLEERFFINVAGAGIDGKVVQDLQKTGSGKGKWIYIKSLLKSLIQFVAPTSQVSVDGLNVFSGRILLITGAHGQYFGGGMHLSPKALPNNGLLDITVVKKDAHLTVFSQLYKLFNGKIASATFVEKYQGIKIEAEFSTPAPVQADGEFIGEAKKVEFEVLQNAMLVLR